MWCNEEDPLFSGLRSWVRGRVALWCNVKDPLISVSCGWLSRTTPLHICTAFSFFGSHTAHAQNIYDYYFLYNLGF